MKNKKILFINQYCGFLCRDLADSFLHFFGSVTLFSGNPESQTLDPGTKIWEGIPYDRKTIFKRFYTWIYFTIQGVFSEKSSESDIWILVSNPPLVPIFMGFKAIRKNKPYFLIIYDLYPEALQQVKFISSKSYIYRLWQKWNRAVFTRSSGIITLSRSMKTAIEQYMPPNEGDKVLVIPNWFDNSTKTNSDENPSLDFYKNRWDGKLVVLYSGNFGLTHDLETLVEIAHGMELEENIHFVLAGEGGKKQILEQLSRVYGLKNIDFLPFQAIPEFSSLLKRADIAVVSLGTGAESISVPSKTYNSMGAGLCLLGISSSDSALNEIISEYQVGMNVLPGSAQDGVHFLKHILRNPLELEKYKSNSLHASTQFTRTNTELYVKFIQEKLGL